MATPNAQLNAMLVNFGNEPDVTPQQVAQLRAAITGTAALTAALNADAANGTLGGFSLLPAGEPSVGEYDTGTKKIGIPAEVLSGSPPMNPDLRAVLKLQDMSLRFAHLPGITADMHDNLEKTLNGSSALVDQFKNAVRNEDTRELRAFSIHTQGNAGGSYSPRTQSMNLVPATLASGTFNQWNMSFVLGHEMEHGFNRLRGVEAVKQFNNQAQVIAADNNPINDYTAPLHTLKQSHRRNEAEAHLAGWNAMLGYEKRRSGNPESGLQEMWANASPGRVRDFLQQNPDGQIVAKDGLTFNPDASLSQTPANAEAMGKHYYDQPPVGTPNVAPQDSMTLGPNSNSDYANYMGAGDISQAIWFERNVGVSKHGAGSRMHVNLERLGYNEALLEQNGIAIPAPATTQQYYDTSTSPPTQGRFDHTRSGPNQHQHVPAEDVRSPVQTSDAPLPAKPSPPLGSAVTLTSPGDAYGDLRNVTHPGNVDYRHAVDCVRRMELAAGIAEGPGRERLAAVVAETAQRENLQLQRIELGKDGHVFAVERGAFPEFKERRVAIDTTQALASTVEQSSERWLQARSPHYAADALAIGRAGQQTDALALIAPADRALYSRIRDGAPIGVSDDHVAQATLLAKQSGITDADKLRGVTMSGDTLWVMGNTPGFRAGLDVTAPAPSMQQTAEQAKAFDQQRAQQVDQSAENERSRGQTQTRQLG
jgi:hypothetical protein